MAGPKNTSCTSRLCLKLATRSISSRVKLSACGCATPGFGLRRSCIGWKTTCCITCVRHDKPDALVKAGRRTPRCPGRGCAARELAGLTLAGLGSQSCRTRAAAPVSSIVRRCGVSVRLWASGAAVPGRQRADEEGPMDEFLKAAVAEAAAGLAEGGIPIGSVLVYEGQIIG